MAGGSGTRLWPLSRRRSPKPLLALTGDTSLLQQTVARIAPLLAATDIYVITGAGYVRQTVDQLPQLPEENVIGEPLARSTAVAVGLWLSAINVRFRDVQYALPFLIQSWLFVSPVAYSASLVPANGWRTLYAFNPLVAVILGWLILGERLTWVSIAAMCVILGGVALVQTGGRGHKTVPAAVAAKSAA